MCEEKGGGGKGTDCPETLECEVDDRHGTVERKRRKREREGRRKHGGGKQLREGEERTALYDNAL